MAPHRIALAVASLLVVCLTVSACAGAAKAPSPTPADFAGIVEQLAKVGIGVEHVVSGDAGCPDAALAQTAIAFDARGLDQVTPVRIRVYIFRNHDSWQRLSASVAACARSYVTDETTYESLAPSPFVVSGQGPWAEKFAAGLKTALTMAAGTGG
jgi:hypothetical protein